jgi:hypothetical protein
MRHPRETSSHYPPLQCSRIVGSYLEPSATQGVNVIEGVWRELDADRRALRQTTYQHCRTRNLLWRRAEDLRKEFAQGFAHLRARVQVCPASKGGDHVGDAYVRGA